MGAPEQSKVASTLAPAPKAGNARGVRERDARYWASLSPLAQPLLACSCGWPARTIRVEHLMMAMLFEFDDGSQYARWLESYAPEDRAQARASQMNAAGRTGLVLAKLGVDVEKLQRAVADAMLLEPAREPKAKARYSRDFSLVWQMAGQEARAMNSPLVWPEHILLAILRWGRPRHAWSVWPIQRDRAEQVLAALNIDLNVARVVVRDFLSGEIEELAPWSERVQGAVDAAHQLAIKTRCGRISPAHLLLALLRDDEDARTLQKYLQAEEVDLQALRQEVHAGIQSDGEASASQPRFTKEAARVLGRCKAMSARAGTARMDETGLLLSLALHGGESVGAWRRVLGSERARAQVKKWYPRRQAEPSEWSWTPRGAWNWAAFLTPWVCWPLGFLVLQGRPRTGTLFAVGATLLAIPLLWLAVSALAILIGRPPAFKRACESFLAGFAAFIILWMLGARLLGL